MENAPKVTYWACWWKATWVLFLIGCVLGYLNGRGEGLARPGPRPDQGPLLGLALLAHQEVSR
jgi:hypothetical protein